MKKIKGCNPNFIVNKNNRKDILNVGISEIEPDSYFDEQYEPWCAKVGDTVWKGNVLYIVEHIQDLNREDDLLTYSLKNLCYQEYISTSYIPEPFIGKYPEIMQKYLNSLEPEKI